jgi:tight adherence protein C
VVNLSLFAASVLLKDPLPPAIISLVFGMAGFLFAWAIWRTLATEDLTQDSEWRYDVNRINELRRISVLYRTLQPVIQAFARFNRGAFADQLPEIGREIQAAGLPRFWTPAEYLARIELQALMLMPAYVYICAQMMGPAGSVMALMFTVLTAYLLRRRLRNAARYRLVLIKRRLPFLLDLVTLLMEAGSNFLQALKQAVDEFREHPVGVEFGRVLGELNMGKGRIASLESMRDRLHDDYPRRTIRNATGEDLPDSGRCVTTEAEPACRNSGRRSGGADAVAWYFNHGLHGADHPGTVPAELYHD